MNELRFEVLQDMDNIPGRWFMTLLLGDLASLRIASGKDGYD